MVLVRPMKRLFSSICRFSINDRASIGGSQNMLNRKIDLCLHLTRRSTMTSAEPLHLLR
jgi:hypothetical protein